MNLSPDPHSKYAARKLFSHNQLGNIPKSDMFQFLSVSEKLQVKKDLPDLIDYFNYPITTNTEVAHHYLPAQSKYVRYSIMQHRSENDRDTPLGCYKICLPIATPGLQFKIKFYCNENDEWKRENLSWVDHYGDGYTTGYGEEDGEDDGEEDTERRVLESQDIVVKCRSGDGLRGHYFVPDRVKITYNAEGSETSFENGHTGLLPFKRGGEMYMSIRKGTIDEHIVSSYADLECITPGEWVANFYGIWSTAKHAPDPED